MLAPIEQELAKAARALKRGALFEALALADQILGVEANNGHALSLKGEAQLRLGDTNGAASTLRQARQNNGGDAQTLAHLGAALLGIGKPQEAIAAFEEALLIERDHPISRLNLGAALASTGQFERAIHALLPALDNIQIAPRAAAGLTNIFEREQRWLPMEKYARLWSDLEPSNAQAWRSLSKALWEMGDVKRALESYRSSLNCGERGPAHLVSFARICLAARDFDQAKAALAEAEALAPSNPDLLSASALLHLFQGKFAEAETYARRALASNPLDASALKVLGETSEGKLSAEDFKILDLACARTDLSANDAASLQFIAGDYHDAADNIGEAFAAYAKANQIALASSSREARYDRENQSRFISSIIMGRSAPLPTQATRFTPDIVPIFIVGMPRSGTTLVESVLAAHPSVSAYGEREAMRSLSADRYSRDAGSAIVLADLEAWGKLYLEDTNASSSKAVVDKNPWNFDCVDLIFAIFPQAKIVHIRRDPVETGFSIFRNQFSGFMTFTNGLADIGHYYGQYARLTSHWQTVYGDRILPVQYETFVDDFERSARALIEFCGLPWDEKCLAFWKTSRTISTITTVAARKPVEGQRRRAKLYASYLAPLVSELEAAGVDLRTGKLHAGEQQT